MSSSGDTHHEGDDDVYLDADEAEEVIQNDENHPMESDDDNETFDGQEIILQNDSSAHFDGHTDSIFCIAHHPVHPSVVVTGSGDETAYIFDSAPTTKDRALLPPSYQSGPQPYRERESLEPLEELDGHTDSVNAVTFSEPRGEYVVTAGLDGRLRVWRDRSSAGRTWEFVGEVKEVEEINWVAACPSNQGDKKNNVIALGAADGSVWVYKIDYTDGTQPIVIVKTFFQHRGSCTAGAWTPDGNLLATVSEDGSFYVYDVFGAAAAAGIPYSAGTSSVVGYTATDQRFAVGGGLYSIAVAPTGAFAAIGGAEGNIKVVGLPRLPSSASTSIPTKVSSKSKSPSKHAAKGTQIASTGAGALLASLQAQSDSVETLSFSAPPLTLLASGSVDGSIALFDTAHRFAVRRHIQDAHEGVAVVKVEFVHDADAATNPSSASVIPHQQGRSWLLTSIGMDGVVRRWDTRGGTGAPGHGLVKEWRGHTGVMEGKEGEQSGGILGFVQIGGGKQIVTAGDDCVALVFEE